MFNGRSLEEAAQACAGRETVLGYGAVPIDPEGAARDYWRTRVTGIGDTLTPSGYLDGLMWLLTGDIFGSMTFRILEEGRRRSPLETGGGACTTCGATILTELSVESTEQQIFPVAVNLDELALQKLILLRYDIIFRRAIRTSNPGGFSGLRVEKGQSGCELWSTVWGKFGYILFDIVGTWEGLAYTRWRSRVFPEPQHVGQDFTAVPNHVITTCEELLTDGDSMGEQMWELLALETYLDPIDGQYLDDHEPSTALDSRSAVTARSAWLLLIQGMSVPIRDYLLRICSFDEAGALGGVAPAEPSTPNQTAAP
ncbi:MAG: hypothetical protein H6739_15610 [Alphaproteobacteria bacterium]|nr:hypothetical protein [Alphaproteobacteria bacterium]